MGLLCSFVFVFVKGNQQSKIVNMFPEESERLVVVHFCLCKTKVINLFPEESEKLVISSKGHNSRFECLKAGLISMRRI